MVCREEAQKAQKLEKLFLRFLRLFAAKTLLSTDCTDEEMESV